MRKISENAAEGERRDAVETGGRLVQEKEARFHEELHGHAQTLTLTAGETFPQSASDRCVLTVFQTDLDDHFVHPLELFVSAHFGRETKESCIPQRLLHREVGEQQIILVAKLAQSAPTNQRAEHKNVGGYVYLHDISGHFLQERPVVFLAVYHLVTFALRLGQAARKHVHQARLFVCGPQSKQGVQKKKELPAVDTPIVFVDAHIFPHSIGNAISVFRVR
jgi:hypothetical protein